MENSIAEVEPRGHHHEVSLPTPAKQTRAADRSGQPDDAHRLADMMGFEEVTLRKVDDMEYVIVKEEENADDDEDLAIAPNELTRADSFEYVLVRAKEPDAEGLGAEMFENPWASRHAAPDPNPSEADLEGFQLVPRAERAPSAQTCFPPRGASAVGIFGYVAGRVKKACNFLVLNGEGS